MTTIDPMALVAGSVFAEYTILKRLGAGGMGKVYLAQHPRLERRYAIKVLRRSLSSDASYRERFQREADAAAKLFHPNIVGVHDRGEYRGRLWIAMDYVDGADLARLVRHRFPAGMPTDFVLAIVSAVAEALDYAHQQDIVHRDVKPGNILVTNAPDSERRVLLADFGIARQLSDPSGLTASNLAIGTVAYAAPEQLMGSDGLDRADQYALAATTFHLLTGSPPFQHDNPVTVISQHLNSTPPKLSERRRELAGLDDVLDTALAKDPADRFTSCYEFADALAQCLGASADDRTPQSVSTVIARVVRAKVADSIGGPPGRLARLAGLAAARPVRLGAAAGAVIAGALFTAYLMGDRAPGTGESPDAAGAAQPESPGAQQAAAPPPLDGTYRVDANRAGQKYNGVPNPQPPNVSTWWAVRSSCEPVGCTATGVMLDNDDHHVAKESAVGGSRLVLDFANGAWLSRPETVPFSCVGSNGQQGVQTTTQVLSLQPTIPGVLHGEMVVTVETDECGQRGAQLWVPLVATRMGDVSPAITMPEKPGAPPASLPAASGR